MEITLNAAEREALVALIESQLSDTRVEVRRTGKTEWQDRLREHEDLLRVLLERLNNLEN